MTKTSMVPSKENKNLYGGHNFWDSGGQDNCSNQE